MIQTWTYIKQGFVITALLLILLFSVLMVLVYEKRQSDISFEANRLLSDERVSVLTSLRAMGAPLDLCQNCVAYRDVDDAGYGVRAVTGDGLAQQSYPVYSGRSFRSGDDRVALAGSQAPVRQHEGRTVVSLGGTEYPVIGRLGRSAESLVSTEVLIADAGLFDGTETSVILDGPGARAFAERLPAERVQHFATGLGRRTTVDSVTPVIRIVTVGLVAAGAAAAAVLAAQFSRRRMLIGHLLGHSRPRLIVSAFGVLLVPGVIAAGIAGAAWLALGPETAGQPAVIRLFWPVGLSALILLGLLTIRGRR